MSKGFPKDILRMSKGHPEGSKGSPEEGLGMYNNAYISMSRNHNDSDLRCYCADRYYQETMNIYTVEMWLWKNNNIRMTFFDENNTKDIRMMSEGCPEDVRRMSRGKQKGYKGSLQDGFGMYRKCIHTFVWAEITMIQTWLLFCR